MERREFLSLFGWTVVVLPVGTFLVHCGDDENTSPNGDQPAAPPQRVGSDVIFSTNIVENHSHTFGIPVADFQSLPSEGVNGRTSTSQAHSHEVSIGQSDLERANQGSSVQ